MSFTPEQKAFLRLVINIFPGTLLLVNGTWRQIRLG